MPSDRAEAVFFSPAELQAVDLGHRLHFAALATLGQGHEPQQAAALALR